MNSSLYLVPFTSRPPAALISFLIISPANFALSPTFGESPVNGMLNPSLIVFCFGAEKALVAAIPAIRPTVTRFFKAFIFGSLFL